MKNTVWNITKENGATYVRSDSHLHVVNERTNYNIDLLNEILHIPCLGIFGSCLDFTVNGTQHATIESLEEALKTLNAFNPQ